MSGNELQITIFFAELLFVLLICYTGWLFYKMRLPNRSILKFLNTIAGVLVGLLFSYTIFQVSHWLGVEGFSMHVSVSLGGLTGFQFYQSIFDIDQWLGRR